MSRGPRYRFILVEDPGTTLPVRFRQRRALPRFWVRRTDPMEALLEAFLKLDRRGEGEQPWAPVLSEDPLTFLLDALGDAVLLRRPDGSLAYANPAARRLASGLGPTHRRVALEVLELDAGRFERRCMAFGEGPRSLVVEVLRRLD